MLLSGDSSCCNRSMPYHRNLYAVLLCSHFFVNLPVLPSTAARCITLPSLCTDYPISTQHMKPSQLFKQDLLLKQALLYPECQALRVATLSLEAALARHCLVHSLTAFVLQVMLSNCDPGSLSSLGRAINITLGKASSRPLQPLSSNVQQVQRATLMYLASQVTHCLCIPGKAIHQHQHHHDEERLC